MSPFRILKLIYNLRHALASRLSVGVAFLVLLGYLCLVWSWWLSILAVTGILISIAAKQFERIGFIWLGLSLICVLMLLGYTGILPSISRRGTTNSAMSSCFETKIHRLLRSSSQVGHHLVSTHPHLTSAARKASRTPPVISSKPVELLVWTRP